METLLLLIHQNVCSEVFCEYLTYKEWKLASLDGKRQLIFVRSNTVSTLPIRNGNYHNYCNDINDYRQSDNVSTLPIRNGNSINKTANG